MREAQITLYDVNLQLSEENLFRLFTISRNMNFYLTTSWHYFDWLVPNIYQMILSIITDVGWSDNRSAHFITITKVKVHYFGVETAHVWRKTNVLQSNAGKKTNDLKRPSLCRLSYEQSQVTVRVGDDEICIDKRLSLNKAKYLI